MVSLQTPRKFKVDVCLPAYNEGHNLKRLLPKLVQNKKLFHDIIVIASGCTDDTIEVAQSFAPHVTLIVQEEREGKASAIDLFLKSTTADVLLMISTDCLPGSGTLERMLDHFEDETVGMVGAHPLPTNNPRSIMGQTIRILWGGHHNLALGHPKMGEMVAWRRFEEEMSGATSVDEAFIEAMVVRSGKRLVYEPRAIVYNHGPENIRELVLQRKRIFKGHILLNDRGYTVSTMNPLLGLYHTYRAAPLTPKGLMGFAVLVGVEIFSRIAAAMDKTESTVWEVSQSTKKL
jgi:cellulose synthase/poly-beta-1,6-N-acetylglucosamine synthase-like glycosyltransferase